MIPAYPRQDKAEVVSSALHLTERITKQSQIATGSTLVKVQCRVEQGEKDEFSAGGGGGEALDH